MMSDSSRIEVGEPKRRRGTSTLKKTKKLVVSVYRVTPAGFAGADVARFENVLACELG